MNQKNNGGPAFPEVRKDTAGAWPEGAPAAYQWHDAARLLRGQDRAAGAVRAVPADGIQGYMMPDYAYLWHARSNRSRKSLAAKNAYEMADALLAERAK
jgi:hypothetical protein